VAEGMHVSAGPRWATCQHSRNGSRCGRGLLLVPEGMQFRVVIVQPTAGRAGRRARAARKLRQTYCAARLQTLDGGAPVSVYTVALELGHGSVAMVSRVLRSPRHRAAPREGGRVPGFAAREGAWRASAGGRAFGTTIGTALRSRQTPQSLAAGVSRDEASSYL